MLLDIVTSLDTELLCKNYGLIDKKNVASQALIYWFEWFFLSPVSVKSWTQIPPLPEGTKNESLLWSFPLTSMSEHHTKWQIPQVQLMGPFTIILTDELQHNVIFIILFQGQQYHYDPVL